jgi:putative ABC transport system permease protein
MFKNYFKIAIRTLIKRKGYSLLNILGLTLGMTCCLLIFHYVSYEKSYDNIPEAENIYRVRMDVYENREMKQQWVTTWSPVGPLLKKEYPSVLDYCRLYHCNLLLSNETDNKKFHENKGYFADASFFRFFNTKLIYGNIDEALNGPGKIAISEEMAKKYFGDGLAIGKRLQIKGSNIDPLEVSAVFKEREKNSHLVIDYLISFNTYSNLLKTLGEGHDTEIDFEDIAFYNYVKLLPGTTESIFDANLISFKDKYLKPDNIDDRQAVFHLTPLKNIHLYSNFHQEAEPNGNGQRVTFLFLIAIFIICIAWVNYINLTTARSVERAKEVGIKKVLGALRINLIKQFITENLLLNSISLLISLFLFFSLLNWFDLFTGQDTFTGMSLSIKYWLTFFILFSIGTLLSGVYPAFVLSGFQPIKVLKGAFKNSSSGVNLRKGLIVTQFSVSIILIAGTIVVFKQLNFMRQKELGINIKQTLILKGATSTKKDIYQNTFAAFKNEISNHSAIESITASNHIMSQEITDGGAMARLDNEQKEEAYISLLRADHDFISSYGIKIIAGRNFSKDIPSDKNAIILNESALEPMKFNTPKDALNKKLIQLTDTFNIIGVMADFHQQGLQQTIVPIAIVLAPGIKDYYSIKINSKDISGTIEFVNKIWVKHFPAEPFNYFFLDESFNAQYKADVLFGNVFGLFAFLAIFIACSGLLGLSSYNVIQRAKEIGIRKILGASTNKIVLLLSKDFVKLILVSLLISLPIGWYIMNQWLLDYAYRISISWWVFFIAGLSAVVIALLTISFQAIKAALANPVKSLRTE